MPYTDGKPGQLMVAHITGINDDQEIITPKEITESHVVVCITELSIFGLIWTGVDYALGRTIKARVLLFLRKGSTSELDVLLLSRNTELEKVGYIT